MKLYVASPLGFSEAGRLFYREALLPKLKGMGLTILDPWSLTDPQAIDVAQQMPPGREQNDAWRQINIQIGARNAEAIRDADALVAVLDGTDVDSGTAAEIGFAFGLGKIIHGYRGDFRLSSDNVGAL